MRRIYFLVPNLTVTHAIVDEAKLAGIEERHIHIIGPKNVPLGDLPEASLLQKSDFIPAIERAIPLGAGVGLLAGLVTIVVPGGVAMGGGALLASMAAGAGVGSLMGSMVAVDIPNSRHAKYQESIDQGMFLMLLDVPAKRVDEVKNMVLTHHPEAQFERVGARVLDQPLP
jgi:hypothetical protein